VSGLYDVIASRYGDPGAFVRRLRSTMLLHGISQGQLARRSGYHRPHVTRWLGGGQAPSMKAMVTLDEALDDLISARGTQSAA
jgi:transcriptional regulator with XRE-family HTH domain